MIPTGHDTPPVSLIERLDAALPQTQCTKCGYPNCRRYAEAMAERQADLNQCPPGGDVTIAALALVLHATPKPLNPANGTHTLRTIATIDEKICIGCRKCIDVCPVDAILGARKLMHTVLQSECTGCGLCVPVCPVDCIALTPWAHVREQTDPWPEYGLAETARWRARTERRQSRLTRLASHRVAKRAAKYSSAFPDQDTVRAGLKAALARARARRRGQVP